MRLLRQILVAGFCASMICGSVIARAQSDSDAVGTIGAGSSIIVGATAVTIPANEETVYFQNGVIMSWKNVDENSPSCRLEFSSKPVARQVNPGRKFIVTKTSFGQENSSYCNNLYFDNDATINQLQCSVGKGNKWNLSIGQLKLELGQLFSLVLAAPVPE
jgi:hypothetical protein